MSTVLPTPAPPNRPILPPCTYGVSRSIDLIPVSNIWVLDSSWSNGGGSRWIGQRSVTSRVSPSGRFSASPMTLNTLPLVMSPTGTVIGAPVSVTLPPRTRPSVGFSAIARTRLSPRCWATSRVISLLSPASSTVVFSALYISGMASGGNSMSMTGPMTRAIRPTPGSPASAAGVSDAVVVMSILRCGWCSAGGQGVGTRDGRAGLRGDLGVPGLVGEPGVVADDVLGVVDCSVHGALRGGELGRGGLQQRVEHPGADVARQQCVQHPFGGGLELVQRQRLLAHWCDAVDDLQREHAHDLRLLGDHRPEPGEDDVQLAHPALLDRGTERLQQGGADLLGGLHRRVVGVAGPAPHDLPAAELVVAHPTPSGHVQGDLLALFLQLQP